MSKSLPLSAVALSLLASSLPSQIWVWQNMASPPINRGYHAMAYDAARQRVILFGGANSISLGDTWTWDGNAWTLRATPTSPSARKNHAMAYDAARQRVVLFAGDAIGSDVADVWEWNGSVWAQVSVSAGPLARRGHAMVYDVARQRVVLFGGISGATRLADTWEWDGANWAPRLSATTPPARAFHSMAYDTARQRAVVFGGEPLASDTWEWDGSNWTLAVVSSSPPGRFGGAMVYSAAMQKVLLFGGATAAGWLPTVLNDSWEWNGVVWHPATPLYSPAARFQHAMVFDEGYGRVMLFGGVSATATYQADTWVLGGTIASAIPYGSGCGATQLALDSVASARPILGTTARALVPNAPTPVTALALGWSRVSVGPFVLPLPLSGFGMSGCFLHQSAELLGLPLAPTSGGLEFALPLPNSASLLGSRVFLQAYGYAPGQNPAEVTTSNGLDWKFGDV